MFSSPLPDQEDYLVVISEYAARHFLKRFKKDHKGRRWDLTESSIEQALKRIHTLTEGQRVDELKRGAGCVLFKYDFAVALSKVSAKASGNRCIVFLDIVTHTETILLVYGKTDLPKNQFETAYIFNNVEREFKEIWERLE